MQLVFPFYCRCGSGLSGECLTDNGHFWVGVDISPHMLGNYVVLSTLFIKVTKGKQVKCPLQTGGLYIKAVEQKLKYEYAMFMYFFKTLPYHLILMTKQTPSLFNFNVYNRLLFSSEKKFN